MGFVPVDDDWPFQPPASSTGRSAIDADHSPYPTAHGNLVYPILALTEEPTDEVYRELLDVAAENCHAFSLVWRDHVNFQQSAIKLADDLAQWLCYERHTHHWAGTTLWNSKAWVRWYQITPESIGLLHRVSGLYQWTYPNHPEDLAFYREDGRGWLGSIAHEQVAWIDLSAIEPHSNVIRRLWLRGLINL